MQKFERPPRAVLRHLRLACAVTTGCVLGAAALSGQALPATGSTSICPEHINAYFPGQVPGDLDLCTWSAPSAFGEFADVLPVESVSYTSCAAFKDAWDEWEADGRPSTAAPAPKGHTDPRWSQVVKSAVKSKDGSWQVELAFIESPVTPSTITLWRPSWPNMNGAQTANIDASLDKILKHEKGHQNLSGKVATAHTKTYTVPKSAKAATKQKAESYALSTYGPTNMSNFKLSHELVNAKYDDLSQHAATQGVLGGVDLGGGPTCPEASLTSADQRIGLNQMLNWFRRDDVQG